VIMYLCVHMYVFICVCMYVCVHRDLFESAGRHREHHRGVPEGPRHGTVCTSGVRLLCVDV
jgi:hypothetical protein